MHKFIHYASWFLTITLAWSAGYICNYHTPDLDVAWIVASYRQKAKAAKEGGAGKIIFLGGSGTHFGVSATQITRDLQRPAVNMGLSAGLGINAIMGCVDGLLEPGDIVVLIPEYHLLASQNGQSELAPLFGVAIGNPIVGASRIDQVFMDFLRAGKPSLIDLSRWSVTSTKNAIYLRPTNSLGDASVLPEGPPYRYIFKIEHVTSYALWNLRRFEGKLARQKVDLVISLPWIFSDSTSKSIETVKHYVDALETVSPLIYDRTSLNLKQDPDLFGDTPYHLSEKGRTIRSRELSDALSNFVISQAFSH